MNLLKKIVFTLFLITLLNFNLAVDAAIPDLVIDKTDEPISKERSVPFFLYFHYGNPTSEKDIANSGVSIKLEGKGIEIVPEKIYDLYDESQIIPACDNSYDGPVYQISPDLADAQNLLYGPRSADDEEKTSGEQASTLSMKETGCIKLGLMVTQNAEKDDKITITFNPDFYVSADYKEENRPGKQIVKLIIGKKEKCSEGEEFINGDCFAKCSEGEIRNEEGNCQSTIKTCESDKELFNNECVEKCSKDEERTALGNCREIEESHNNTINKIVNVIVIIFLIFIAYSGWNKLKRFIRGKLDY